MQAGYFSTAWKDIKSTPHWMGKMLLLALLMLIPVFGVIVAYGYLFGWARDIAWGISRPMPKRIFGNEDGKLYSRGFFICVLVVACAFIPVTIDWIGGFVSSLGIGVSSGGSYYASPNYGSMAVWGIIGILCSLVGFILTLAMFFVEWPGAMRISIYGRISAGFQFNKIWAMIRNDTSGILKIFGMNILTSLIVGIIVGIAATLVVVVLVFAAIGTIGGISGGSGHIAPAYLPWYILGASGIVVFVILVVAYLATVFEVWVMALTANALGYWTRQFNVPAWRGQKDPMPFELQQAAQKAAQASYYQPSYPQTPAPPAVSSQQQPYQPPQATPAGTPQAPPADTQKGPGA